MLSEQARALDTEGWMPLLAARLDEAGIRVDRMITGVRTMHPEVHTKTIEHRRGRAVEVLEREWEMQGRPSFLDSPIAYLSAHALDEVREHLTVPEEELRFPITRELKREGFTDYVILRVPTQRSPSLAFSFATTMQGGFSDEHMAVFEQLLPALSVRLELEGAYYATEMLLETYLGGNASRRVLDGDFRRGSGERIQAAIWMSDLRGFTARVDRSDIREVLTTLDTYFGCVGDPVTRHGGEILKFIGDAVLAIFSYDDEDGAADACQRAMAAARDALAARDHANASRAGVGLDPLEFGLALHVGDVMYGNIGGIGRLDFTVIGRAVNEAARVEAMCKSLDTPLLLTGAFVESGALDDLVSLGKHELRGVSNPTELFTLGALKPR